MGERAAGRAWIAILLLIPSLGSADVADEKAAWEQRFGPFEDLALAHAVPAPNDTAATLEELGPALGVDLVPKSRAAAGRSMTSESHARPLEWKPWLAAELARPEADVASVPAAVLAWHEANRGAIDQVRHVLLTWKPPEWEQDLSVGPAAPLPNLLGILTLGRVLVADALVAQSLGDDARADADLEAAWNLGVSLLGRAEEISMLIAMADAQAVAVALRKVERGSPAWPARLDASRFRESLVEALRAEARFNVGLAEGRWNVDDPDAGRVRRWFYRRTINFVAARELRAMYPAAEELAGEPRCDDESARTSDSGWLDGLIPSFGQHAHSLASRADALGLHFELTRRVIEVRAQALATGVLPPSLPGGKTAAACPSHAWRWRVDGTAGRLEGVRLGGPGVGHWWDDGRSASVPMTAILGVP